MEKPVGAPSQRSSGSMEFMISSTSDQLESQSEPFVLTRSPVVIIQIDPMLYQVDILLLQEHACFWSQIS